MPVPSVQSFQPPQQPVYQPSYQAPYQPSSGIWDIPNNVFMEIIKWGVIAGLIAGLITWLGSMLMLAVSWAGILGGVFGVSLFGITSIYSLVQDLFWGAFWGAITSILVVKFYDKFPFKTLFMKIFGVRLIIDIIIYFIFGGFLLIFAGPLSLVVSLVSFIIADFVFAKIIAGKIGPLTGLP